MRIPPAAGAVPRFTRATPILCSTALCAVLAGVVPATAQDKTAHVTILEEIVVSAGAEKVAISTPQAVTVIDQEDMDREQARTVGGLFADVPGVQTTGASARPLGQAFNIRGIGNAEQAGSQNRIIVTVDGAVKFFEQYRTGSFFGDPELYKRVEVLRGPASSTLYGSGAIGGVVNFTTKDPGDFIPAEGTGAVRAKAAYDSNGDGLMGSVIIAQKLGPRADMLASFATGKSDDMKDGAGAVIQSTAAERWSGLLKTNIYLDDAQDQVLTFSLSRTDTDLDRAAVAQTGGGMFIPTFGFSHLRAIDDTATIRYRNAASGNPWLDLDVQLSYSDTSTQRYDFTNGFMCGPGTLQVLCDNEAAYKTVALRATNTVEFGAGAWQNYLTFGIDAAQQKRTATSSAGPLAFHPGGEESKLGAFVQGEFIWNDRLTITPGLRVDRTDLTPDAAAIAAGGAKQKGTAVSPKIAALYEINDNWGLFGSAARTERMPTLDELFSSDGPGGVGRVPSLNLRKEKATTVELGVTYRTTDLFSAGDRLTAKLTVFNNDLTDLIAANARAPGVPYFSNINRARIWGGEIEAAYEADRWFGRLAYSKVKSRNKTPGAAFGTTLADTPAENLALTLGMKLPDQGLRFGWRVQAFDDITTASATTTGAGHAVHDLFASWQPQSGVLQGLQIDLGVENLFDREYRNNLALDNSPGRNVKLSIAKAFQW
ncbi:TonB-dependent receptor domain-containing protein [Ruixingdingia sedimenti]|uniref:TonB-dependent receptor n=1 Tax=Ruixingdingia sedimenti TaxID=3073604 RepID=A0ABU1F5N5_9RHOB|nr:TonB-dependent receptor [Xinfangfangia sp. LG-4]MDR5652177.1 TonB-dependent receptor [Xinfangfangia sp. LG-4]